MVYLPVSEFNHLGSIKSLIIGSHLTGHTEKIRYNILIPLHIFTILLRFFPFNKTSGVLGWLIQAGDEGYLCSLVFDIMG